MSNLTDRDRAAVRKEFEKLAGPVKLVVFSQELVAGDLCRQNEQLVREVAELSEQITVEVLNPAIDRERAGAYGVDQVPAIVVEGARDYGLRFYVDKSVNGWPSYWIHGRDLPGYPASHGCIGLYDEEMQKEVYQVPKNVILEDAKLLYRWVVGSNADNGKFHKIEYGPRVLIIGDPPM